MARKKKEKDILDQILDTIGFKGLTQDEVVGQGREMVAGCGYWGLGYAK